MAHAPDGDVEQLAQVGLIVDDEDGIGRSGGWHGGGSEWADAVHATAASAVSMRSVSTKALAGSVSRAAAASTPVRSTSAGTETAP
ncbi:hypothetical protein FQZ97_663200 [compost metagenome]